MHGFHRWSVALGVVVLAAMASCSSDEKGGDDPIVPDPTGSVRATVTGDGSALSGVTVRLFADGGATALESGTTATNGQVAFDDLDAGEASILRLVVTLAGIA